MPKLLDYVKSKKDLTHEKVIELIEKFYKPESEIDESDDLDTEDELTDKPDQETETPDAEIEEDDEEEESEEEEIDFKKLVEEEVKKQLPEEIKKQFKSRLKKPPKGKESNKRTVPVSKIQKHMFEQII